MSVLEDVTYLLKQAQTAADIEELPVDFSKDEALKVDAALTDVKGLLDTVLAKIEEASNVSRT